MLKRSVYSFFAQTVFGLALLIASLTAGYSQSTALSGKSIDAAEISSQLQSGGTVRVIVQYQMPQGPARANMGSATENIPAIVRENHAAQDAIFSSHFGSPSQIAVANKGLNRFDLTPGFAITATAAEIQSLAGDSRVTSIEIDRVGRPQLTSSVPLIGMISAYGLGATGSGWAVAVLDTGVETTHTFLAGQTVAEGCFSTAQGTLGSGGSASLCPSGASSSTAAGSGANCNIAWDGCEHGTHVAGISVGLNSQPLTGQPPNGVAKSGKLIAVKMYSEFTGSDCVSVSPCVGFYFSDFTRALDYVYSIRNSLPGGVKVAAVNLSGGSSTTYTGNCDAVSGSATVKTSIDNLRTAGIATIISAGNGSHATSIAQPACISSAIAVAASKKDGDVISSYTDISSQVALFAPGGDFYAVNGSSNPTGPILSSVPTGFNAATFGFNCNYSGSAPATAGSFCHLAGTSMAAPTVAGAFAAIKSACPTATVDQILAALISTGTPISDTRSGGAVTKPRIRVDLATQQLCGGNAGVLAVSPTTDIAASGKQGGPFTPSSFSYQVSATGGSANFTISGVPAWLTASATSGTASASPITITFTVNAGANSLAAGSYSAPITFTNSANGQGNTTRQASLTVTSPYTLVVAESSNIVVTGAQGGPFTPASFTYHVTATGAGTPSTGFTITGVPSWLNASPTTGTATASATSIFFTVNSSANSLPAGTQNAQITITGANGSGTKTIPATLIATSASGGAASIVSSVLPNARTTTVGTLVTAFAAIINSSAVDATGCFMAPPASYSGTFLYQTTSSSNIPLGTPNSPVTIGAGKVQNFFFAVTPSQTGTQDIPLIFGCTNAVPPTSIPGLNTLLLSTAAAPIPDMLSISATPSNDGNLVLANANATGFMVTAAINIGAPGTVTFTPTDTPFGQAARNTPVALTVCQTNSSAQCLSPASSSVTLSVAANQILTFAVFVAGQGTQVAYDPANRRIFLIAQQGSTPVGETSAALKMNSDTGGTIIGLK